MSDTDIATICWIGFLISMYQIGKYASRCMRDYDAYRKSREKDKP